METILKEIYDGVMSGNAGEVPLKVNAALEAGIPPATILNEGMIAAMNTVGKLFEEGEFFVPEMLISARAMQAGLAVLKPKLALADVKAVGRVVAGTVKGDLHDIGKNL